MHRLTARTTPRLLSVLPIGLALVFSASASAALAADEVYQWKDANGVTHYSQTPPQGVSYKSRTIYHRPPSDVAGATAATAESSSCTNARKNIELLQSGMKLQMDSDGDGAPDRDLADAERQEQLEMAQLVMRTSCEQGGAEER